MNCINTTLDTTIISNYDGLTSNTVDECPQGTKKRIPKAESFTNLSQCHKQRKQNSLVNLNAKLLKPNESE
jgi:hypothetical protein